MDSPNPFRPPLDVAGLSTDEYTMQPNWLLLRCGVILCVGSGLFAGGLGLFDPGYGPSLFERVFGGISAWYFDLLAASAVFAMPVGVVFIILGGIRRLRPAQGIHACHRRQSGRCPRASEWPSGPCVHRCADS